MQCGPIWLPKFVGMLIASYLGSYCGGWRKSLVHTVCTCAESPWNSTAIGFYRKLPLHDYVKVLALHFEKDMDRSRMLYSVWLGCPSITLKPEQKACVSYIYEGKGAFSWLQSALKFARLTVCYEVLPIVFDVA